MEINKVTILQSDQGEYLYLRTNLPQSVWPFRSTGQQLVIQCAIGTSREYFELHFNQFATPDCEFCNIDARQVTLSEEY
jgi:hypothetical protein